MEEQIRIVVRSIEEDTGINYSFLFSQQDAEKIIENEGEKHFELENDCYAGYAVCLWCVGKAAVRKNANPHALNRSISKMIQ